MRMWRSRGMWRRSRNGSRSARKRSDRRKNGRERKRNEGNERERGERGGKAKGERETGSGETEGRGETGSGEGDQTRRAEEARRRNPAGFQGETDRRGRVKGGGHGVASKGGRI